MKILHTIADVRAERATLGRLALVPTMGALHIGHLSLVAIAKQHAPHVAVSIFVNPTQFGPREDFSKYPRPLEDDLKKCEQAGVDLVFNPTPEEMYRPGLIDIAIDLPQLTGALEGAKRPGHFKGVCQVVAKLFNVLTPNLACFGQKDYQQLRIIQAMADALDFPIEIIPCPTLRDADGLAMSSRNVYLSPDERQRALAIPRALRAAEDQLRSGYRSAARLTTTMRHMLTEQRLLIDYVAAVDPVTFKTVENVTAPTLLAIAARSGNTRLIDNIIIKPLVSLASLSVLMLLTLLPGCTHVNQRLNHPTIPLESRQKNHTRSAGLADMPNLADADGCFVGVSISGGGLRSANFGAACMIQLQRLGLLQKADYLSAVSGGALPAAYYCIGDDSQWNPGNVQRQLTQGFASEIIFTALLPWNSAALLLTPWDSTDVLADTLDRHLFRRDGRSLTFADLRQDRPRLLIHATDLQSGHRFIFSNESFDELNSDLSKYPIAHAVAASSAFPVVLQAKTLRDYSTIYKQYRHFIDGGVSDNLGVQSLIDVYEKQNQPASDSRSPYPRGAVIIIIDADTRYDARLSDKPDIGMLEKMRHGLGLSSTALVAKANNATLTDFLLASGNLTADQIRRHRSLLEEKGHIQLEDRHGRPIRLVYLSLRRLRLLKDLPFPSFNETIENIGTYYNIKKTEAYRLYQAADLLVRDEDMQTTLEGIMRELGEPSR